MDGPQYTATEKQQDTGIDIIPAVETVYQIICDNLDKGSHGSGHEMKLW